jgi:hypothetical protein
VKAAGSGGEFGDFLVGFAAEGAVERFGHFLTSVRIPLTVRDFLTDVKMGARPASL